MIVIGIVIIFTEPLGEFSNLIGMIIGIAGGLLFRQSIETKKDKLTLKKISFIESISPLEECRSEFFKMVFAVLTIAIGMLIFYLGKVIEFGYFGEHPDLSFFISICLLFIGAIRSGSYIKCIVDHNRKNHLL